MFQIFIYCKSVAVVKYAKHNIQTFYAFGSAIRMSCQKIPGQECPDPICCLGRQILGEAKSQPVVKKRPYGTHSSASGFMPSSCPCPRQLHSSCSPQMRQGKAGTCSHVFLTCVPCPTLLGEQGGKVNK